MHKFPEKLIETRTILSTFLIVYLLGIAWQFRLGLPEINISPSFENILFLKLAAFAVYIILAFLTLKNVKIAVWFMASVLVLSGLGISIFGIFAVGFNQFILKTFSTVFGVYFVAGGVYLPRNRTKT